MSEIDENAERERHRAKMAKRKAAQDAEVAGKAIAQKGLLMVHTGTGKGKSTAAFGLVLRMLGYGKKCAVVQFIKGAWNTGERKVLEGFGPLMEWHTLGEGFTWETQDKARDIAAAAKAWETAKTLMQDPALKLLVLDELNIALRYDYLPDTERSAPRSQHRGDGPQREAADDRGGGPRHRDDFGEAPFRARGEGARGH